MTESIVDILAWNVYVGNTGDKVLDNLEPILKNLRPEVAVLMEASRLYPFRARMERMGYKVIQLKPKALRPGSQPGQGNICLLVRNDVKLLKRFTLKMLTFWRGPKHGWSQDPRVYRWVRIKHLGQVWKIGGAHTPFGTDARTESRRKLVRWFNKTAKGRPTILVLDANMHLAEFRDGIAKPGGALAGGVGIDLIGYKNARLISAKDIGHHGSDHPAMFYKLEAK